MVNNNLTHLRICLEKPLHSEKHVMQSIRQQSTSHDHFQRLRAAFLISKLWPKGNTISIQFIPNTKKQPLAMWTAIEVMKTRREPDGSPAKIDPIEYKIRNLSPQEAVKMVLKERIAPLCDLKFIFVQDKGNVRIGFNSNGGSWSLTGTDCLKSKDATTMNFGWLDAATMMHEFGHMIGMIHEHDNPRGNPIEWNKPALFAWAKQTYDWDKQTVDTNIIHRYDISQLNASKFDPYSIMLYFFPAKLTLDHKATNINQRLSREDVKYIYKIYQGDEHPDTFYERVYGESITGTKKWWKILLWVVPLLILLVVVLIIWRKRK